MHMCTFAIQNVSKLSISISGTLDTDSWICFLSWSFRSLFPLLPFLKLNSKNHEIPKMGTIYMFCFIIITKRINFVNILMIFFSKTDRESLLKSYINVNLCLTGKIQNYNICSIKF